MYTAEQVAELVEREVTKRRVDGLEQQSAALAESVKGFFARLEVEVSGLKESLAKHSEASEARIKALRVELEKDFVLQTDHIKLVAKVDQMWVRITTAVAVSMVATQIIMKLVWP